MRMPSFIFVSLLAGLLTSVPVARTGTTPVNRLVKALQAAVRLNLDPWKVTTCLPPGMTETDLSRPGYDDAAWSTLRQGTSLYVDVAWLRKEFVLPERIAGHPVQGGTVRFRVSVDDYGYLWVNGEARGRFPWDGEFVLTQNARPGQQFVLVIKAVNTGGPLRLLRAEVILDGTESVRRAVEDLSLELRVAQKLLGTDTYQTNRALRVNPGVDRSRMDQRHKARLSQHLQRMAERIDVDALRGGAIDRFFASVQDVRRRLQPVRDFVRRFTLFLVSNAHIDAAWLWRDVETIEVCRKTFTGVLDLMDQNPHLTYAQSSAAYYVWMEERYPQLFQRIRERVRDGRWEVVGGMWVEADANMPSGESWVRSFLYAQRYFRRRLGIRSKIGWLPDSFGFHWNVPQFLQQAGMPYFVTQKINWNDTTVFPYRLFWWEAPDGSRVLTYIPFRYDDTLRDPYRLVDWLRQFEANTGLTKMLVLFGVGDHGGGPTPEIMTRIERMRRLDIFPIIEFGTVQQYFAWLETQDLSRLPVWRDELYLEYHRGTYTTHADMKAWNRRMETLLTDAETFATVATLLGGAYDHAALESAWRKVLFNQFHDILPGSGITAIYRDATVQYRAAEAVARLILRQALERIARTVDTSGVQGTPVLVFNPLGWTRTDVVEVELPEGDAGPYAVFDSAGQEIPTQTVRRGPTRWVVLFIAEDVPPVGYRLYTLRRQTPRRISTDLRVMTTTLENRFFRIELDPETGWIRQIIDKRAHRLVLQGFGNELQVLEDRPDQWDAWNIGLTGKRFPTRFRGIEVVETGPVRAILRVRHDFRRPDTRALPPTPEFPTSFFVQDIILYRGLDLIDFRLRADWWEEHMMLKVAFPVNVQTHAAAYGIPFGTIERSTRRDTPEERARWEVPALRWADLSQGDYGVSLINRDKYGYDVERSVMRLSLLRAPTWPDPTADRGRHTIAYALIPHPGTWRDADIVRRAFAYNRPLIAVRTDVHRGPLPPVYGFVRLEPEHLVLTALKVAEDGGAWVVRWYEAEGQATTAVLTVPRHPQRVVRSNFLEEDGDPIPVKGYEVRVPTRAYQAVTVKVFGMGGQLGNNSQQSIGKNH